MKSNVFFYTDVLIVGPGLQVQVTHENGTFSMIFACCIAAGTCLIIFKTIYSLELSLIFEFCTIPKNGETTQ